MNYVYIVLINYNSWKDIIECVKSIFENDYKNFKIVIVDNKSNNNFELEKEFCEIYSQNIKITTAKKGKLIDCDNSAKEILLIKNDCNNGFAAGCNCAFNYIRKQNNYSYVWLLGCDNIIEKNSLVNLIRHMQKNQNIDLCGSVSINYFQRDIIQCCGFGIYNKFTSQITHFLEEMKIDNLNSLNVKKLLKKYTHQIVYVYGNSMFFSKKFFSILSDIPENYFIYFEELEIIKRLENYNMKFDVAIDSFVYHKEGSSTGGNKRNKSLISDYYSKRNRILFTLKYYKLYLPLVYIALSFVILCRIKNKQFDRAMMILKLMFNPYPKFNEVK